MIIRKNHSGWIQVEYKGSHYEIGLQHGTILKEQMHKLEPMLKYLKKGKYESYINQCKSLYQLWITDPNWQFIYDELRGISEGSGIHVDIIFAWNMLLSLDDPKERSSLRKSGNSVSLSSGSFRKSGNYVSLRDRCSAFIWSDGANIVMAHNTHSNYITGLFTNVVAHIYPIHGYHFKMQTAPGLLCSCTDWFITSAGIIGCETTLKQTDEPLWDKDHVPYFFRIRKAMEQGTMMDDYVKIMSTNNAGDYGCQWLLGNINTGHIMQMELTLNEKTVTTQTSGYFVGANMSSWSQETVRSRNGARYQRLQDLISNKSNISLNYAKKVLADHYDLYTKKVKRGTRTICSHKELSPSKKHEGTVDGKVINTELAKQMQFMGKFGSSCNETRKLIMTKSEKAVMPSLKIYGWTKL